MKGQPIEAVKTGLANMVTELKKDPVALKTIHFSVITYDRSAKLLVPMTPLAKFKLPDFPPLQSSPTNLGEALYMMCDLYAKQLDFKGRDGDRHPVAMVLTDGGPSDTGLFNSMCEIITNTHYRFPKIIACAAGPKAKVPPLHKFATNVVTLDNMADENFNRFWEWLAYSFAEIANEPAKAQK
jgi:uncharacterized protein YegL